MLRMILKNLMIIFPIIVIISMIIYFINNHQKIKNREILEKLDSLVKEGAVSKFQYLNQLNKISSLEGELIENKVILKYQEIKAPISGQIFDLKPWGAGYFAQSNEPVAKIVPNDNLIAKVEIDSRKIGFVSLGKLADISIDSFPATDFGVIEGKVTRIGSDSLPPNPSLKMIKNSTIPDLW